MVPGPLTLAELIRMAEAKGKHDWAIASNLMVMLAEPHRDKKKRAKPFTPADFNPLAEKPKPKPIGEFEREMLKTFFNGLGTKGK